MRCGILRRVLFTVAIAGLAAASGTAEAGLAAARTVPALGHWTLLSGTTSVPSGTPAIWQDGQHRASILWMRQYGPSNFSYQVAPVAANGTVGTVADAFAG